MIFFVHFGRMGLPLWLFGVIDVVTAVITAPGAYKMMTTNTKEIEKSQAVDETPTPKAAKKASARPQVAHVTPGKGKAGKKASSAKKTSKGAKKADKPSVRQGSKTAQILELLKRPGGATMQEIMKATEWQPHSVRGFISATLGKKMGLNVESAKSESGERTYSLKS